MENILKININWLCFNFWGCKRKKRESMQGFQDYVTTPWMSKVEFQYFLWSLFLEQACYLYICHNMCLTILRIVTGKISVQLGHTVCMYVIII